MKETKKWELLGSEYLIRRPWMTARRDHVRLPSGVEMKEYYVLEYPTWINVTAVTRDGRFVMERQYRHGLQYIGYEICAGVVEEGEEPLAAAKRELLEETGYAGGEWKLVMTLSANPSTMTNLTYCFLAEGVEPVTGQSLEATEDIAVELMSVEEVRDLLTGDKLRQALMAAPLWKYFAERHLI